MQAWYVNHWERLSRPISRRGVCEVLHPSAFLSAHNLGSAVSHPELHGHSSSVRSLRYAPCSRLLSEKHWRSPQDQILLRPRERVPPRPTTTLPLHCQDPDAADRLRNRHVCVPYNLRQSVLRRSQRSRRLLAA